MLILGVIGPRPDTGRPSPLQFIGAELPATRPAIRDEEPLRVLDRGKLVHADGGQQRSRETDEDGFAINGHAVPVVEHQEIVSAPADVAGEPVAMTDHGCGAAGSEPVTSVAPGVVDPFGTGHLVEVDVGVIRRRPTNRCRRGSSPPTTVQGPAWTPRPAAEPV